MKLLPQLSRSTYDFLDLCNPLTLHLRWNALVVGAKTSFKSLEVKNLFKIYT